MQSASLSSGSWELQVPLTRGSRTKVQLSSVHMSYTFIDWQHPRASHCLQISSWLETGFNYQTVSPHQNAKQEHRVSGQLPTGRILKKNVWGRLQCLNKPREVELQHSTKPREHTTGPSELFLPNFKPPYRPSYFVRVSNEERNVFKFGVFLIPRCDAKLKERQVKLNYFS